MLVLKGAGNQRILYINQNLSVNNIIAALHQGLFIHPRIFHNSLQLDGHVIIKDTQLRNGSVIEVKECDETTNAEDPHTDINAESNAVAD